MFSVESELHLSKDSSAETISEQKVAHDQICEMLVAAGYFRARISSLPPFDKMLGGLAWCITASNVEIDVDLFFDEEMTLGTKIHLGENIVAALTKMKCPTVLQPHQIRGLDFQNMFPVFQWLVKQVIATREERGAQIRRFSELQFNRVHKTPDDIQRKKQQETSIPFLKGVANRFKPERKYRRSDEKHLEESAYIQCVLLEYGRDVKTSVRDAAATAKSTKGPAASSNLANSPAALAVGKALGSKVGGGGDDGGEEGGENSKEAIRAKELAEEEERRLKEIMSGMSAVTKKADGVSGSKVGSLVGLQADEIRKAAAEYEEHVKQTGSDQNNASLANEMRGVLEAHKRQVAALQRQINLMKAKYQEAQAARADIAEQTAALQGSLQKKMANSEKIRAEIEKLKALETPENAADLQKLMVLVTLNENLKQQEEQFKGNCKRQLQELQQRVADLDSNPLPDDEMERLLKVEELYNQELAKFNKLRQLLAKKTQEAQLIKRRIDEIPTRTELVQYERRFVELYEQVAAKLEETRRYYTRYNSLTDSKKFLMKEISVMNSIFENYGKAMEGSDVGKDKFVDSIEAINKGVLENLAKTEGKLSDEKGTRDDLNDKYNKLQEKQRLYFKAVKEFQDECTKNEKLTGLLGQQQRTQ